MPKGRRNNHSRHESEYSPYQKSLIRSKTTQSTTSEVKSIEWKDARCPICMEYPHNAMLLICSSHTKGCHPFMCDTSYRHSNCFDQYCKMFDNDGHSHTPRLLCPLCRGEVKEWIVIEKARRFLNDKTRACARETCGFSGTYRDLRTHARRAHPSVRPSKADAGRESDWRRLEWRRDLGDLFSTLQLNPTFDGEADEFSADDDGGWLTFFFFVAPTSAGTSTGSRLRGRRQSRLVIGPYERETLPFHDGNESEPFVEDSTASQ